MRSIRCLIKYLIAIIFDYFTDDMSKNLLKTVYNNEKDLLQQVRVFIESGVNLSKTTSYGESPLRVSSNNGRFDVVKALLDSGADSSQLGWTESFYEVAFGTVDSLKNSISKNNDLEERDFWERTPWLLSLLVGDIEKSSLLLELGGNRNAVGKCGKTPFAYAIQHNNVDVLKWLVEEGVDIESTDKFLNTPLIEASELGMTQCVEYLINQGADIYKENHIPERAIQVASNLDIVQLLVEQGDDINDICEETHADLLGVKINEAPQVSREELQDGVYRKFGKSNPEKTNIKYWIEMIKCGASAWQGKRIYSDIEISEDSPAWSYQRFGKSTTILGNGHIIEIAGEHEDYYDPDFCIYNDVVVFDGKGNIDIFSYPEDVFPPTDFHTATLVGNYIYIIGSLGYMGTRQSGHTPVFRLDISTMEIEKIKTTGKKPGWISGHKATLDDDLKIIIKGGEKYIDSGDKKDLIENKHTYQLDLESYVWQKLS